ncbi:MAG: glycogen synthase [Candidatus Omnitrophota bacterium]
MKKALKVLFCSSEVLPFVKTGGLADVSGSLPLALEKLGVDVRIVMPKYKGIDKTIATLGKDIKVYFVENDAYFARDGLYGIKNVDFPDNLDRFSFFSKKILELLKEINFKPDVIHANDWQCALIPAYLRLMYNHDEFYKDIKTVFTIHNLAYQGLFPREQYPKLGIDRSFFTINGFEFYDKVNLMKGAIIFSDVTTTVSPTYAKEIQTDEYGCGLHGLLAERSKNLYGILNGLDYNQWNPAKDKFIPKKYSFSTLEDKYINKRALQKEVGLEVARRVPLFGLISRLVDQKGLDILTGCLDELLQRPLQLVLLGTGEPKYHQLFGAAQKSYPHKINATLGYDASLAQKIYASSDIFLMPSKFEPCGLGQIISLRYGTVPLVRKTGGLADTIIDISENPKEGTGFVFSEYSSKQLLATIDKALELYKDKTLWKSMIQSGMKADFSWKSSAKKYVALYQSIISKNATATISSRLTS